MIWAPFGDSDFWSSALEGRAPKAVVGHGRSAGTDDSDRRRAWRSEDRPGGLPRSSAQRRIARRFLAIAARQKQLSGSTRGCAVRAWLLLPGSSDSRRPSLPVAGARRKQQSAVRQPGWRTRARALSLSPRRSLNVCASRGQSPAERSSRPAPASRVRASIARMRAPPMPRRRPVGRQVTPSALAVVMWLRVRSVRARDKHPSAGEDQAASCGAA